MRAYIVYPGNAYITEVSTTENISPAFTIFPTLEQASKHVLATGFTPMMESTTHEEARHIMRTEYPN